MKIDRVISSCVDPFPACYVCGKNPCECCSVCGELICRCCPDCGNFPCKPNYVPVWTPDYTGKTVASNRINTLGIQAESSNSSLAIKDGNLVFTPILVSTSGGRNLLIHVADTHACWNADSSFVSSEGETYRITFTARVASGTGAIGVKGNNTGSFAVSSLTTTPRDIVFDWVQEGTEMLRLNTGSTALDTEIIISNLKISRATPCYEKPVGCNVCHKTPCICTPDDPDPVTTVTTTTATPVTTTSTPEIIVSTTSATSETTVTPSTDFSATTVSETTEISGETNHSDTTDIGTSITTPSTVISDTNTTGTVSTQTFETHTTSENTIFTDTTQTEPTTENKNVPPVILVNDKMQAIQNSRTEYTLTAVSETSVHWSFIGNLPSGLSVDGDKISGIPTVPGKFQFIITAQNVYGTTNKLIEIEVLPVGSTTIATTTVATTTAVPTTAITATTVTTTAWTGSGTPPTVITTTSTTIGTTATTGVNGTGTATTAISVTTRENTGVYSPGDIMGTGEPTIGGVLEMLKHLANMKSRLDDPDIYKAACITGEKPVIGDVLEMLKWLAGMDSAIPRKT